MPPHLWHKWLKTPLRQNQYYISETTLPPQAPSRDAGVHINTGHACFTCNECSNICPIFGGRDVFDPLLIIRMANLGLSDQLLRSPSIWLCLGCQRCTDHCTQLVRGHEIIQHHQEQAIAKGIVDPFFPNRLLEAERLIYPLFLDQIDALLGMYTT
jgi:heterodisulfide reductase subunit C